MGTIRVILALAMLMISTTSFATEFSCEWQASDEHQESYYQDDSGFVLSIVGYHAQITDQGFFQRSYSPCWKNQLNSCTVNFRFDRQRPFDVMFDNGVVLNLEQHWWFTATLRLQFEKHYEDIKTGESTVVSLRGSDGNITQVTNEDFLCTKL